MSGGRRKEEPSQPQLANGALKVSVWSKVLRSDAAWEDKDEFLDVIYWFRQIIAVVLGVIWGVLPLRGFLGIAGFCLINAGVLYLYFSNYLQIDEEEYGGTWELTKEGFMTSFALFMVCVADSFTTGTVHFMRCHLQEGTPLIELHYVNRVLFF
uniref:RAB5 interacting factor n=1 Tax=Chlorocebus sabaeus TaxID=60711 RepID=A0A0D9RCA3_CHLSB